MFIAVADISPLVILPPFISVMVIAMLISTVALIAAIIESSRVI